MSYVAPLKDMLFVMNELAGLSAISALPGYEDATPETVEAVLEENARFCSEVLAPLNFTGDRQPSTWHDGRVTTSKGFKEAFTAFASAGWQGLQHPAEFGGQALPKLVATPCIEMLNAANLSFALCPLLTDGAIEALITAGTDAQKEIHLANLISGKWTGTMNLTEPQAGSDLAMVRTRAVPQGDGSYKLFGTKIFITYGEHDMAENIIHMVLARTPDAPPGVKGISLFIVPKFLISADGTLGARNDVHCVSIEHKLGIKASPTAVLQFGDHGGAIGTLVGEENRGLEYMFIMMNAARFGVGMQGVGLAECAYQKAVQYAKDRVQSRDLAGSAGPVAIIHQPDVRRMLMSIKSLNEAARALVLWTALKADVAHRSDDEKARQAADDHMGLLTPVLKGVLTDNGLSNSVMAQQIFGGHGYIAEHGMEQFVRDARITMIYEGANGIQALDLVGRKLGRDGGRAITAFFGEVSAFVKEHAADEAMKPYVAPLGEALATLQQATMWFMQNAMKKPDNAGAGSTDYMHLFGLVAMAYMWAQMAKAAQDKLKAGANGSEERMKAKLVTGRFFMERMLPESATHLKRIQTGADTMMALPAEAF